MLINKKQDDRDEFIIEVKKGLIEKDPDPGSLSKALHLVIVYFAKDWAIAGFKNSKNIRFILFGCYF